MSTKLILSRILIWHRGVVVITTTQLHSTKPKLWFRIGSNPARGVSEIRDGEDPLPMVPAGNKAKSLSAVNHIIKTIHYHEKHRVQNSTNVFWPPP